MADLDANFRWDFCFHFDTIDLWNEQLELVLTVGLCFFLSHLNQKRMTFIIRFCYTLICRCHTKAYVSNRFVNTECVRARNSPTFSFVFISTGFICRFIISIPNLYGPECSIATIHFNGEEEFISCPVAFVGELHIDYTHGVFIAILIIVIDNGEIVCIFFGLLNRSVIFSDNE